MARSPLDNKEYLDRLRSFTLKNWGDIPVELSPLVCASKGWIYDKGTTIKCQFCQSRINVNLPATNSKRCQAYVELLNSRHKKSCIWSTVTCPEYFVTDETPDKPSHEIRMRLAAASMANSDNFMSAIIAKELTTSAVVTDAAKDIRSHAVRSGCDEKCMIISLHGWQLRESNGVTLLTCDICRRRLNPLVDQKKLCLTAHLSWCVWIKPLRTDQQCLIEKMVQFISQENHRKRKRESLEYQTSEGRLDELKEIKRFFRKSIC